MVGFFFLFSVPFMNHQLLFKCSQSQLGEKVSPKPFSTACVCLKSSQTQRNRTLRVGRCLPSVGMCVCVCVLVETKCAKLSFLLSCSLARGLWREGGVCAYPPPDPSSLPPSGTVLPAMGSVVGRCVRMCV